MHKSHLLKSGLDLVNNVDIKVLHMLNSINIGLNLIMQYQNNKYRNIWQIVTNYNIIIK